MPIGSRARLEHDCICLAEAYQWDPEVVMRLPVSRRHRFIKIREMIVDKQKGQNTSLDQFELPESLARGQNVSKTGVGIQHLNDL